MAAHGIFAPGEWYHCYNRGVEKRRIFEDESDYRRFLLTLHLSNGTRAVHVSNQLHSSSLEDIWVDDSLEKGDPLVEIGAYCCMPNHFHMLVREINGGGVAKWMQKALTGYTMYFNKKHGRTGALLAGVFKSKHIGNDRYLKHAFSYVHCNPIEIHEPDWKEGIGNIQKVEGFLKKYSYSSLPDFMGIKRPEGRMLAPALFDLYPEHADVSRILVEAQLYYQEHPTL